METDPLLDPSDRELRHRLKRPTKQADDDHVDADGPPRFSSSSSKSFRPLLDDPRSRNDPAYLPEQFQDTRRSDANYRPPKPWSSILLGLLLLVCGLVALATFCSDVLRGYEDEDAVASAEAAAAAAAEATDPDKPKPFKRSERFYPLLFLGLVAIIPGCFVSFFTCMACLGVDGYSYDDIP